VNVALASDYAALSPYTITTNYYAASVASAFSNRGYWTVNERSFSYVLRSSQLITPYPEDRYFFNDPDLKNPQYLKPEYNADVVANSAGSSYAYVSMYIVHTAFDTANLAPYYSSPTFLGVFLLPDTIYTRTVSFSAISADGGFQTSETTTITFTLSEVIPGLVVDDFSITESPPNSGLVINNLQGTGPTYTLNVSGVTTQKNINVTFYKPNTTFSRATSTSITVQPEQISISSAVLTSNQVILTFDKPLFGLDASHISFSAGGSVTGSITSDLSSAVYTIPVAGVSTGTTLTITKPDSWIPVSTATIP
jgi:hypothetical protein